MVIRTDQILELVRTIAEERQLQATVQESLKGGLAIGVCSTIGGIFAGPVGLGLAGAASALIVSARSYGNYKSLVSIINEDMTDEQRMKMVRCVETFVQNLDERDLITAGAIIMRSPSIQQAFLQEISQFLKSEMSMALKY